MFTQKKSFFKGKLFYVLLVGIFAFGYWINQSPLDLPGPEGINTDSKLPVESQVDKTLSKSQEKDILDHIVNNRGDEAEDNTMSISNSALTEDGILDSELLEKQNKKYYLVKELDGFIKVFQYDSKGNEKLIRTSDITFSLLSEEDQNLFRKGIIKNSEEELNELLQDFES